VEVWYAHLQAPASFFPLPIPGFGVMAFFRPGRELNFILGCKKAMCSLSAIADHLISSDASRILKISREFGPVIL
jgi:hypothetical protein